MSSIPMKIDQLYEIIPLTPFRKTPGVSFDIMEGSVIPRIDSLDRVLHEKSAVSPGPVGDIERPWYMHPHQDDNLMVFAGVRHVEIYTPKHGKIEHFDVYPDHIEYEGKIFFDGPAMLVWPRGVFHRIVSGMNGSASLNLAVHYDGWDVKNNFDIYSLDESNGEYKVIREGWKDQK